MTASVFALRAGAEAATYYTNDATMEGAAAARDEYYALDGAGTWWTTASSLVRHDAHIDKRSFSDLCAGIDPKTGRPLVRAAGPGHRAGWDCTLSAPKTFSILWMSGTPEQRRQLEAIQADAVDQALKFVVDEGLVSVRLGAGGLRKEAPTDVIVGRFAHYTTRDGDPQLHTHCVLLNSALSRDGRYRTLEPSDLYGWQLGLGSVFRVALAERIVADLGLRLRPAGQGQFEIAGVPQDMIDHLSKRSAALVERLGGDRTGSSAARKEVAALATRGAKADVPTGPALEARWRDDLVGFDLDPWAAARDAAQHPEAPLEVERDRGLDVDPLELVGETPVRRAATTLFRHETVVERKAVLEHGFDAAALQGIGIANVRAELAALERDDALLRLTPAGRDTRWTTPSLAKVEAALLRAADRPAVPSRFDPEAVQAAFAAAPQLSAEQRAAVEHVAASGGVVVVEAGAGPGKTTTARAIVDAAHRSGLKVLGLAPSWVAADELSASTGIPTQAIAKWRHDLAQGQAAPLDADTLVIVDEAGMVGTRDMEAVLTAAAEAGARVMLTGDRRQLAAVAGASPLRSVVDLLRRHGTLGEVRRQTEPWQRAASVLMARGEVEDGLRAYGRHGRIALVAGTRQAQERVIELWTEARARHGDGEVIIATRENRDAAALNAAARHVLRKEGKLTGADTEVKVRDRDGNASRLPLAVGEQLRFGEGLTQHGIRNGTRGTVTAIGPDKHGELRLAVRLEDGRTVEDAFLAFVPGGARRRRQVARTLPRIAHAYAGTVYAAQGRTVAETVLYVGSATDAREVYVGLTRHRQDATMVVERERLEAAVRGRQADPRLIPSEAELQERLYVESRRYADKRNVVDHVEDRAAFIRTGTLSPPEPEPRLDLRRGFEAGRRLRAALRELAAVPGLMLSQVAQLAQGVERRLADRAQDIAARLRAPTLPAAVDPPRPKIERDRSGPDLSR